MDIILKLEYWLNASMLMHTDCLRTCGVWVVQSAWVSGTPASSTFYYNHSFRILRFVRRHYKHLKAWGSFNIFKNRSTSFNETLAIKWDFFFTGSVTDTYALWSKLSVQIWSEAADHVQEWKIPLTSLQYLEGFYSVQKRISCPL